MYLKVAEGSKYPIQFKVFHDNEHEEHIGLLTLYEDRTVSATVEGGDKGVSVSSVDEAMEWIENQFKTFMVDEIRKLVLQGKKINAIKLYRQYVDPVANLQVAKNEVEKILLNSMCDVQVLENGKYSWGFFHPNTPALKKGDIFEAKGRFFEVVASDSITIFVEEIVTGGAAEL